MKYSLFLQGFAAAILTLCAACTADLGDTLAEPQPLVFSAAQLEGETTFTRAAIDGKWDGGEQVAIQIGTEVKKYNVDESGALTPDDSTTPFYRTNTSNIDVTAWYPYSDSQPTASTIIANDQRNEALESSNLMTASATAVYGKTVALTFSHQTARLRIYLTDPESNNAPVTGATVTATIGGSTYTTHEDGSGYYSLLVAPETTVAQDADFLTITASGKTYEAASPTTATFAAGTSYNYTFALKRPPYLTFTASSEQGFQMSLPSDFAGRFQYSVNNGTWTTVKSNTEVTFGGDKRTLRLRGVSADGTATSYSKYCTISFTNVDVPVTASGDIRTLVDYKNHDTADTKNARFCYLFQNCTALTSAPQLSAETLADYCYFNMFYGCKNLTAAPALPAETLEERCYASMFQGCTELTGTPTLQATKLANRCYLSMFYGCTNLKTAPKKLPAETLADGCYYNMFYGCTELTEAPELPAKTLKEACYRGMFNSCTKLTEAPKLPAETLAVDCYREMFNGCTGLTEAPKLPATELQNYCYEHMFNGCKGLTEAPELPATTLVPYCYACMFQKCSNLQKVIIRAESTADRALSSWLYSTAGGTIYCKQTFYDSTLKDILSSNWSPSYITD